MRNTLEYMVSEPLAAEAIRLAAGLAALCAGVSAAQGIHAIISRGNGGGAGRSIRAMVAASGAVAAGAWAFVAAARYGSIPGSLFLYAGIGLAAGLLAGLFPKAAGLPLLATGILAGALATAGLGGWLPWTAGTEAARLTVWSATGQGSLCSLRTAVRGGLSEERNLELGPGSVQLEFEAVEIQGPLSVAFGSRRYRTVAAVAGDDRFALPQDRGPLFGAGDGGILARLLGCSIRTLVTPAFEPATLATVSYVLQADGSIAPATQ
jgi:hypothetical protein